MKKILFFLILYSCVFFSPVFAFTARSIPKGEGANGWTGAFFCDSALNLISFKDAEGLGMMKSPWPDEMPALIEDTVGYCLSLDYIGSIFDYNTFGFDQLWVCPVGTGTGRDPENPTTFKKWTNHNCCPNTHPFTYSGNQCCDRAYLKSCQSPESVPAEDDINYGVNADGVHYFEADILYTCAMTDCLFKNNEPAATSEKRGAFPDPVSLGLSCFKNQDTGDFDSPSTTPTPYNVPGTGDFYCIAGTALSPEEYNTWVENGKLNAYIACKEFKDPQTGEFLEEYTKCVECIDDCDTCVYSSLGCVDTTLNGVITTVMRIGLGVLGAVGIFRIMQAAMLRQSADPKDIQESWDIIMSVIMGAIVLVASSLILRVIGVNVLGILPFDF